MLLGSVSAQTKDDSAAKNLEGCIMYALVHQTNIRQFAERFFSTLLALMDKELNPYVKGYRFEETPIDWQGQK